MESGGGSEDDSGVWQRSRNAALFRKTILAEGFPVVQKPHSDVPPLNRSDALSTYTLTGLWKCRWFRLDLWLTSYVSSWWNSSRHTCCAAPAEGVLPTCTNVPPSSSLMCCGLCTRARIVRHAPALRHSSSSRGTRAAGTPTSGNQSNS